MYLKERIISIGILVVIILFIPIFITSILNGLGERKDYSSNTQVTIFYNNEERTIDLEKYIEGVVAAEMPISFEMEALKAQAVAARTYTLKKIKENENIVFSSSIQSYCSEKEVSDMWNSENYPVNYAKLVSAVSSTKGEVILYKDEVIDAVFHSTSGGKTLSAMDMWGQDIPYLQSVDSLSDINAPTYLNYYSFLVEDFISIVDEYNEEIAIDRDGDLDIQIVERNLEGYIQKIQVANKVLSGGEFRVLFSLASSNFTIEINDNKVDITCRGYGHGVGMSQYGANYFAKKGYTYSEILKHYYTGCEMGVR